MAKMVLTSSYLSLAGSNVSSYCSKIELTINVEKKNVTTFASLGWTEVLGGLKSGTLAVEFFNDMVDADLDNDMFDILGTVVAFEVRATNAVVGVNNPKYTGTVLIDKWSPVSGKVGDVNAASYSYDTSAIVTRAEI
jgi:hypothetical protein